MEIEIEIQNQRDPQSDFAKIADKIMNKHVLVAGDFHYRITELEFYYYKAKVHADPYAHKDDMQLQMGKRYFHGSGLDIAFGDGQNYGGILIRAIAKIVDGKVSHDKDNYTYGPLSLLKELFTNFNGVDAHDLKFGLLEALPEEINKEKLIAIPRFGLSPSKDNNKNYYDRPYRF